MRNSASRRLLAVLLSLAAAALGCARADVGFVPVTPDYATRQPPTATITRVAPTATVAVASPTLEMPPTAAPASTGYPVPATAQQTEAPTPTLAAPTQALTQADVQAPAQSPTLPPTRTPPAAKATATTVPPTIAPPQPGKPVAIPANATFTQKMAVTGQGGEMIGDPGYLIDGRTETWAALNSGHTAWVFDLGTAQKMAGVKVYAQKPRSGEATTLLAIEVSNDGQNWQAVLVGSGNCGEPNCDVIPQMTFTDIGFNPVSARYLRLRSGPNRFGFTEVAVAIVP